MSDMTLREICNTLGVSRRAVQGYETAGLVSASGRNKYGHLLYDKKAQKRIELIRLYQQFGFTIREIKELIDAPEMVVREALERQILLLKEEQAQTEILIKKAYELLDAINEKDEKKK